MDTSLFAAFMSNSSKYFKITLFVKSDPMCVCQAEEWVSERMQKMAEDGKTDLSNLQAKMKLLQKHQVFEAEILAHGQIIASVLLVRKGEKKKRLWKKSWKQSEFFTSCSIRQLSQLVC